MRVATKALNNRTCLNSKSSYSHKPVWEKSRTTFMHQQRLTVHINIYGSFCCWFNWWSKPATTASELKLKLPSGFNNAARTSFLRLLLKTEVQNDNLNTSRHFRSLTPFKGCAVLTFVHLSKSRLLKTSISSPPVNQSFGVELHRTEQNILIRYRHIIPFNKEQNHLIA